jgi:hypothetical protein
LVIVTVAGVDVKPYSLVTERSNTATSPIAAGSLPMFCKSLPSLSTALNVMTIPAMPSTATSTRSPVLIAAIFRLVASPRRPLAIPSTE